MHQHQTDHGEHKARQQLNDHGMYPEVEAAEEELVTNTDQTHCGVHLPKEHRVGVEVHMVHGLVLPR